MSVTRNAEVCTDAPGACRDSVDIGDLLYIAGVDADLCEKFTLAAGLFSLTDCTSTLVPITTPVVTCTNFNTLLCARLAALTLTGPVVLGTTQVVGKDCSSYTIPETVLTRVNSPSITLSLVGIFSHTIRADLVISPDAGNAITLLPNGVYAPAINICAALSALGDGAPSVPNVTRFVGPDCQTHVQTETPLVATDTTTIDFTTSGVSGHDITGMVVVDPDADNLLGITAGGLSVTCTDIQACIDICPKLAERPLAGAATPTTRLIADDCNTYTLPVIFSPFTFTSPSAISHVIVHNLNNSYPSITVWDTIAGAVIIPDSIVSNSPNTLTITFFVAVAIAGTIVG